MKAYIFHEGPLPSGIALDYDPAIFNLPEYLSLQNIGNILSFYLLDKRRNKAVAGIHFYLENHLARSPFKAPFGSLECADGINPVFLYRFLEDIELQLTEKGISGIYIKNPPDAYAPGKWALLETFFLNQKYIVSEAEVSAVIRVTEVPFAETIRHSEKLRLRQAEKAGFTFSDHPLERLPEVYDFISACHREKGYKLSVSQEELQTAVKRFPDRYLLFAIFQQENIRAAAISLRVTKNILYNFLVNHEMEFNHLSPAVLLMEGIYKYCYQKGIDSLDLGTSAWEEKPNFPLLDFKMHLGGLPASKFSFYKKIG